MAVLGDSLSDPKVGGGGYLAFVQERCPKTRIDNFAKKTRRQFLCHWSVRCHFKLNNITSI